jgi:hypothetical protein
VSLFCQKTFSQRKKGKKESESSQRPGLNFAELMQALCGGRTGLIGAVLRPAGFCVHPQEIQTGSLHSRPFLPFFI